MTGLNDLQYVARIVEQAKVDRQIVRVSRHLFSEPFDQNVSSRSVEPGGIVFGKKSKGRTLLNSPQASASARFQDPQTIVISAAGNEERKTLKASVPMAKSPR